MLIYSYVCVSIIIFITAAAERAIADAAGSLAPSTASASVLCEKCALRCFLDVKFILKVGIPVRNGGSPRKGSRAWPSRGSCNCIVLQFRGPTLKKTVKPHS